MNQALPPGVLTAGKGRLRTTFTFCDLELVDTTPQICPTCGELVIARPDATRRRLVLPAHPDRVFPFTACTTGDSPQATAGLLDDLNRPLGK